MSESNNPSKPVRAQPQQRVTKGDRTRAQILDAAYGFLWSRPFRELTVSSLMASTGTSRVTFYRYFNDLHDVMETLLDMLQSEILEADQPWFTGVGDPVALLQETFAGLVRICYERGPFLRAVTDAAATDKRLDQAWTEFLATFDDAGVARIEADQKQGLIPDFDVRPVAFALNRLNAYTLIQAFGKHPRSQPEPIRDALARIFIATLYGTEWVGQESSNLVRK